ncbi:alpha/beta hydrolase family protein [Novosphingobium sp.]|uniref:alpha/beta hydrolase family protein n=1 Tax=Novosphingobium sp. TaxID=1874826 RepID=UPI0035B2AE5D
MRRLLGGVSVAVLALAAMPVAVYAQSASELAAKFGARPAILDISMSPGGTRAAIIAPAEPQGEALLIADLVNGGAPKPILASTAQGEHLRHCDWPSEERLVCQVVVQTKDTGDMTVYNRMIAVNVDGSDVKSVTRQRSSRALGLALYGGEVIDWNGGKPGEVLMTRLVVPESDLNTRLAQKGEGLAVERVDTSSLRSSPVEQPVKNAVDFISDGRGNIRVMGSNPSTGTGYDKNFIDYFYRKPGERSWTGLGRLTFNPIGTTSGFAPVAVDPDANVVYGFDDADGHTAVYRVKLDGSGTSELVIAKPGIDVDGLVRFGRSGRVVGATYAGEYRRTEFFDPILQKLRTSLGKALPGQPLVDFLDASEDENRILVFAGSDRDPGMFYLFDRSAKKLEQLLPMRPQLAGVQLAEMKPVSYPAKDGTMIPAYLTLPVGSAGKNLPTIVMPHGGPGARDEWGFDWMAQFFAARGYAVLQPNYRGSAGYGSDWFEKNGFQSWRTAIGDIDDGGRWLVAQGIAAPDKLAIVGWSYGGYAALQSQALDPSLFKAVIAIAPVTDLARLKRDHQDYTDYLIVSQFVGDGPHLREGSPAQNADKFAAPVLLFHGEWDWTVDPGQSDQMAAALRGAGKPVDLVKYPGQAHSIDNAADRADLLTRSDSFLRKAFGMPTN